MQTDLRSISVPHSEMPSASQAKLTTDCSFLYEILTPLILLA